jgi:hypothetical protein
MRRSMGRGVIGICATAGALIGGYLPALWGGSAFGFASLFLGGIGAVVGVLVGARISG